MPISTHSLFPLPRSERELRQFIQEGIAPSLTTGFVAAKLGQSRRSYVKAAKPLKANIEEFLKCIESNHPKAHPTPQLSATKQALHNIFKDLQQPPSIFRSAAARRIKEAHNVLLPVLQKNIMHSDDYLQSLLSIPRNAQEMESLKQTRRGSQKYQILTSPAVQNAKRDFEICQKLARRTEHWTAAQRHYRFAMLGSVVGLGLLLRSSKNALQSDRAENDGRLVFGRHSARLAGEWLGGIAAAASLKYVTRNPFITIASTTLATLYGGRVADGLFKLKTGDQ